MRTAPAFGGGEFMADKSSWARAEREQVRGEWRRALGGDQILTCSITTLELLYSARSNWEFERLEEELAALRSVPVTQSVQVAAIGALRDLAPVSHGYHRVKPPEALIAAAAQEGAVGVLHYDRDFDRLAEVLEFESRWAAAPGTLD